jgi:ATP-dependent DNA helicase RecQ
VLRGELKVMLRESLVEPGRRAQRKSPGLRSKADTTQLDAAGLQRLNALKAWRSEVAREHNLPAYVIFHDSTLIAVAGLVPQTLAQLGGISGMGVKKIEAYGEAVLRVVATD